MKSLLVILAFAFQGPQVHAAEITPGTLIGHYKAEARVGFQKVMVSLRVLNTQEFEVQRLNSNGSSGERCNGTYLVRTENSYINDTMALSKVFKGSFTCPSDRSKTLTFDIDFQNKKTEDLAKGTYVTVSSSMAPGRSLSAYVKKQ